MEAARAIDVPVRRPRLGLEGVLVPVAVAAIAFLVLVPLAYLVWRTFFPEGHATLDVVRAAYGVEGLGTLVANSLLYGIGATAVAVTLGTLLAFVVVRTDVPWRGALFALVLVPLLVPGVLYTISWIFLASPRSGFLNVHLPGTFDIFSLAGMIVVEGLHLTPLVFLLLAAAFRAVDPALEESALASGASLSTLVRRITLPLVRPAIFAACFLALVRALEGFEVPALLGIPAQRWVFTSRIWRALTQFPSDFGAAGAYSLSLLVLTALGVLLLSRLVPGRPSWQTLTGRSPRARPLPLGRWRAPVTAAVLLYLVVAVVLPLLMLLYVSTQPFYSTPTLHRLSNSTLSAYSLLTDDATVRALRNSVLVCAGAATAVVLLTAVAAWLVVRTRVRGRSLVDALASLPIAVPGVVLGAALLFLYLRVPVGIYGTLWILFIAYVTRFLPYGMRYGSVSLAQISGELEEAAEVSGASRWQAFRRIVLPLAAPGIVAAWLLVLTVALRELSSSLLLYSPGNEVLSVRIWLLYQGGQLPQVAALGVVLVAGLTVLTALAYACWRRLGVATRRS